MQLYFVCIKWITRFCGVEKNVCLWIKTNIFPLFLYIFVKFIPIFVNFQKLSTKTHRLKSFIHSQIPKVIHRKSARFALIIAESRCFHFCAELSTVKLSTFLQNVRWTTRIYPHFEWISGDYAPNV